MKFTHLLLPLVLFAISVPSMAKPKSKPKPCKVEPVKLIKQTAIRYPTEAFENGDQDTVRLKLFIDDQGKITKATPIIAPEKRVNHELIAAARKGVTSWQFQPARCGRKTQASVGVVNIVFTIITPTPDEPNTASSAP